MSSIDSINLNDYSGVSDSSKDVKPGEVFVAVKGERHDGHDYIVKACDMGAALIVMNEGRQELQQRLPVGVKSVFVSDTRTVLGAIASHFYPAPANIVAVTGTSGKTSVTFFVQQILSKLGMQAASIGTLGVVRQNQILTHESCLTTPGTVQLHKLLGALKISGVEYVAMEASSHGLAQHRVDGISFKGAAFTSFSRDHLDYHKDMEEYLQTKLGLFESVLKPGSFALINSDMEDISDRALKICEGRALKTLSYGRQGNFVRIIRLSYRSECTEVEFSLEGKTHKFRTALIGEFQVYNVLCALGIVLSLGFGIDLCLPILESLSGVPGRMQRVREQNVYVDNSHKPDALKNALMAMRSHMDCLESGGKLIVVFGCGGDRDKGKRPEMSDVADELADVVIITDDNPRSEDPARIRREIIAGHTTFLEIGDRKEAIHYALTHRKAADFILVAGRGCEQFQLVGSDKIPFDDYQIVLEATKGSV